jgi:hypothetical protein
VEVTPKRLQAVRQLLPVATTIALLINPTDPVVAAAQTRDLQSAARRFGVELHVVQAISAQMKAGALVIGVNAFFGSKMKQLAALALRHAIPAIYTTPEFVAAGGLMSYGISTRESHRIGGAYTGRILKGEKPADLPVQQATKIEVYINMKTAKALGIEIPLSLLARADEVIALRGGRQEHELGVVSFIGMLRSVRDGAQRRHHRSPALTRLPARQDPGTEAMPPRRARATPAALFAAKCQSFRPGQSWKDRELTALLHASDRQHACDCGGPDEGP